MKSDTCREKLKDKREVYRRNNGRQELRSCIRSGISQAANVFNVWKEMVLGQYRIRCVWNVLWCSSCRYVNLLPVGHRCQCGKKCRPDSTGVDVCGISCDVINVGV